MRTDWIHLNERERAAFGVLVAFLNGRLASEDIIKWALQLSPAESVKRAAVLHLIDNPDGRKLPEPWRSAWRLIEEYWDTASVGHLAEIKPYDIGDRVKSGDRSGSLLAAITDCVAPSVRVSAVSQRHGENHQSKRKPLSVAHLLSMGLSSGKVIDPHTMGLHEIDDDSFLTSLANSLESVFTRGLDTARRLGWDGEHKLYQLGQLHRVYFVTDAERTADEHEPDEFHEGIAPCVKLLHFVVNCLAKHRATATQGIVSRWRLTESPVHARLWSALARDAWVVSASDVFDFLNALDERRFWDVQNFPEIAELRAVRFREFDAAMQKLVITRLRKLPPRTMWPPEPDAAHLAHIRLYWSLRELRRIEIAGGALDATDRAWFLSEITKFPELARTNRLDEGFVGTSKARSVPPNPDASYDNLVGDERLSALETALGSTRGGWDHNASGRAWDWIRQANNAATLIPDLEASVAGGAAFPKVWERFGWAHSPNAENNVKPQEELTVEAMRVLALIGKLSETGIRQSIEGISHWMSTWQAYVVKSPVVLAVWQRLWPIAVEATNEVQAPDQNLSLNLASPPSPDREPMDLDTLNTPAGRLVGVFFETCPRIIPTENPFAQQGITRTMRDTVISATGRSGLIVRHRLIEELPYFLQADGEWAEQLLIGPLLKERANAESLWRALARRTQFTAVLKIIGAAMVERATDLRLGRETRRSLVFSLVVECLHALNENRAPAITYATVQQMIRALDDEMRAQAAGAIQQFLSGMSVPKESGETVSTPESLFDRAAAPFLRDIWPQERSLSTPGVSKALADLPAIARNAFVAAVDAIQRFLVPFDTWSLLDYGLFGEDAGEAKLSNIDNPEKADALMRLLDCTIGTSQSAVIPYDLGTALAQIESVAPDLIRTPIFRRLATAARR